jgi:ABC-2 type transport system ATP-binding protein
MRLEAMGSAGSRQPAACLDRVSCRVRSRYLLDEVSLQFAAGQVTGILGPNGAGKSTLLSVLIGLRQITSGTASVLGLALPHTSRALRRRIGVVLQDTALYDELTVEENFKFSGALYGIRDLPGRIDAVLGLIGLSERRRDPVSILSGGMRRRVAIARALLHEPELLVIDEPTLGVDVDARHAIWSHIRVLRSHGTSVIVATNYLDEAQSLCDVVAVLSEGRVMAVETPDTLVARAGRCVDIDCTGDEAILVGHAVQGLDGILRVDQTPSGAAVFLEGGAPADPVVWSVLHRVPGVGGVRVRAADLAEVFRALAIVA